MVAARYAIQILHRILYNTTLIPQFTKLLHIIDSVDLFAHQSALFFDILLVTHEFKRNTGTQSIILDKHEKVFKILIQAFLLKTIDTKPPLTRLTNILQSLRSVVYIHTATKNTKSVSSQIQFTIPTTTNSTSSTPSETKTVTQSSTSLVQFDSTSTHQIVNRKSAPSIEILTTTNLQCEKNKLKMDTK